MPLRCLDPVGQSLHSFDLSDGQWQALKLENKKVRHLRMPCCASQVTLKRSRLSTPFFAHKARGICTTAPETEEHLHLKRIAVHAARAHGWKAETEITGTTPSGEQWKADVLAQKGDHKVAVEIQWSGQTNDETLRRQEQYKKSGVRGLWLLRQPGFPITRDLPAVCVGGSLEGGFTALVPHWESMSARDRIDPSLWHQAIPMGVLLEAAFSKRFRFGVPLNVGATLSICSAEMICWHRSCRAKTRVLTGINISFGAKKCRFSVPELGKYPELLRTVLGWLPENRGIGKIKLRFSKTEGQRYVSNGCVRCDRLMGDFFVSQESFEAEELCSFPVRISQQWQHAIDSHCTYRKTWGVYMPPDPSTIPDAGSNA